MISLLFITAISCKKECEQQSMIGLLLPAVQKVRESANRNWQPDKGFLKKMEIPFSEPVKPEFSNFKTDTSIHVTCRLKLKGTAGEKLLPYSYQTADGTSHTILFVVEETKAVLYYHNTAGAGDPLPTESISFNFARMY